MIHNEKGAHGMVERKNSDFKYHKTHKYLQIHVPHTDAVPILNISWNLNQRPFEKRFFCRFFYNIKQIEHDSDSVKSPKNTEKFGNGTSICIFLCCAINLSPHPIYRFNAPNLFSIIVHFCSINMRRMAQSDKRDSEIDRVWSEYNRKWFEMINQI